MMIPWLSLLLACWGANAYIVEGTVVEVRGEEVVLDHEPVEGLMPAMVMPFAVDDPALVAGLAPGDTVLARYELREGGGRLTKLRVTGHGPVPEVATAPAPLQPGEGLPAHTLPGHKGAPVTFGLGQGVPTALTFLYTRCPLPEACPALMARLQALDAALAEAGHPARIVAVTLDPAHDSPEVLATYARELELSERFELVRAEPDVLDDLAFAAGMNVLRGEGELDIVHGLRLLVLDPNGALVARYDDVRFPLDAVIEGLGPSPR